MFVHVTRKIQYLISTWATNFHYGTYQITVFVFVAKCNGVIPFYFFDLYHTYCGGGGGGGVSDDNNNNNDPFFPVALLPNGGHGLFNLEVSRSHTTTRHSR